MQKRFAAWDVPAVYAAALLGFYLLLPPGGYARIMEGKYTAYLVLTVPFILWGALHALRLRRRPDRVDGAALGYLACCAVSALASPYGGAVLLGGTRHEGLLTLALYVLSFLLLRRMKGVAQLVPLLAAALGANAMLIFAQLGGHDPLHLYPDGLGYHDGDVAYPGFYAGTSGNVDFTAYLLAMGLCVLAALWLLRKSGRAHALLVPLGMALAALLFLRVDGALVGLAAALLLSPAFFFPRRRKALVLLALLAAAAAAALLYALPVPEGTLSELQQMLHGRFDGGFGSGRLGIWREVLALIGERPLLGGGPDTLWLRGMSPFYWYRDGVAYAVAVTSAHNEYLGIAVNQGLAALACFLMLPAAALVRAWRGERRSVLGAPALLCALAQGFFSVSTCITAPFLWLLLAVMLPAEEEKPAQSRRLRTGQ